VSLLPGHAFANFEIVRVLGKGATGTVYLARQVNLGRECALKVLAPELVRDQKFLERFRREGQIAAALRHANIVRIFDLVEANGDYAIAMDYIQGVELQKLLENGEKLSLTRALKIMLPVFEALEYAHGKGVVHRDIKPANILIEDDGGVYLTDFSIARMAGANKLTQTGTIIGTPEYMAPEQFDGKDVDARADLYAAALIFYEMLAGVNPFRGETLAEVVKKQILVDPPLLRSLVDIPQPLEAIIHKGLSKAPEDRLQTAAEVRQVLQHFINEKSTNLIEPSPQRSELLQHFLSDVESGQVSMDDAIMAREKMKEAIDRGFKRQLTIVMLDLAGSSKIKIPNQTLIADRAFRDYRATINAILEEQGCERYDWSGDGAIALFTAPVPAVTAAVKVQLAVGAVGDRHTSIADALKVRIGIRTGLVYHDPRRSLGEFASRTVDQAGHLEKDCPPGMIHVGDETAKAIADLYPTRLIGKNRDDVEVYEIDVSVIRDGETELLSSSAAVLADALPAAGVASPWRPKSPQLPAPETFIPTPVQHPVGPSLPLPVASPQSAGLGAIRSQPAAGPGASAPGRPAAQPPPVHRPEAQIVAVGPLSPPTTLGNPSGPWWGWRYLALAFFLYWGCASLNQFLAMPEFAFRVFRGLLGIQLMALPPYVVFCMSTGKFKWAQQAAIAFVVFTVGFMLVAARA
jgi:serine/threonine-protein kinase